MTDSNEDKLDDVDIETETVEDYHDTDTTSTIQQKAKEMLNIDEHQFPLAGVLFSSLILLIAVVSKGGPNRGGYLVYGIILAIAAMTCAMLGLWLNKKPEIVKERPELLRKLNHFLFVWSFIGACIMTFGKGPFVVTSNGYFASWGMVIFAVYGLGVSSDVVKNPGSIIGHLACSLIVIIALASANGSFEHNKGTSIFGMIVACLSALVVGFQVLSQRTSQTGLKADIYFPIMAVLAIFWVISACLMTFSGPFLRTGNGYFGSWGGAITAVVIAMMAKQ